MRKTAILRSDTNRALFVDKLCERWLAERAAVALYERAIERFAGEASLAAELERVRGQEALHQAMLEQLLAELGHNPREEPSTFSVNLAASEMSALLELVRDPRLELRHVLEVLLASELLDGGGWELLLDLAKEVDLDEEWLRSFRAANREEAEHHHLIRSEVYRYERGELLARNV